MWLTLFLGSLHMVSEHHHWAWLWEKRNNNFLRRERVRRESIEVWQLKIISFNLQFLSLMAITIIGPCLWKIFFALSSSEGVWGSTDERGWECWFVLHSNTHHSKQDEDLLWKHVASGDHWKDLEINDLKVWLCCVLDWRV